MRGFTALLLVTLSACGVPDLTYAPKGHGGASSSSSTGGGGASSMSTTTSTSTGDCTDTQTNADHCGACDRPCSSDHVGSRVCVDGVCVSTCEPGFFNCKQPAAPAADDGCEADGCPCGVDCPSGRCEEGACACDEEADCGTAVKESCDTSICECDTVACNRGETCVGSSTHPDCACGDGSACPPGGLCCDGACIDADTDPKNCGSCGRACPPGFICAGGVCDCNDDNDNCNAGSIGTCVGRCACGMTGCAEAQRCQPSGECG